ncbi:MAG TPA: molybdate ABC transporter substrate-binding protein, partial [Bacillota bacterium]|nr:molybdate ABC transporter substrate-binding protein [Bacillota bacterium]
ASYESLIKLVDERLIAKEDLRMMAGNALALVVPKDVHIIGQTDFHYLLKPSVRKIAIGNPTYVPAGLYAVELLEKVGIMKNVQEKLLYAANVRQALAWVETGSVDAAIVYGTDAKISHSTKVVAETTPDGPIRIRYGIAILQRSKDRDSAEKFIQFIMSKREIWKKYGFLPGE